MTNRIKVGYSWIGPKGPTWNTELPNVLSFANVADGSLTHSHKFWCDSTHRLFQNRKDLFEVYPNFNIDLRDDHGPFLIPFTFGHRIYLHEYFRAPDGILEFAHLSRGIIDKVRNGDGYIVLEHGVEAYMYDDALHSMHAYFQHVHKLPLHKVIYLTGAMNCKEVYENFCERQGIPDDKYNRLTILPYPSSINIFQEQLKDEPFYNTEVVPEKLFLMWNRRLRQHRVNTLLQLEKLGLIDRSYVSCPDHNVDSPNVRFMNAFSHAYINSIFADVSKEIMEKFASRLPLTLDGINDVNKMCNDIDNVNRPYYQNSLISLVTETNFENFEVTLTEKSFKPLKEKHPFITVGARGTLKALRELGFETFSEFWDESYDECKDQYDRTKMIAEVLYYVGTWDNEKILDFKRRVKPKLEHNFNHIKSIGFNPILTQLHDIVWNQK